MTEESQVEIAKMVGNGKSHELKICGKVIRDLASRRWAVAALLAREQEANRLRAGVFRQNLDLDFKLKRALQGMQAALDGENQGFTLSPNTADLLREILRTCK